MIWEIILLTMHFHFFLSPIKDNNVFISSSMTNLADAAAVEDPGTWEAGVVEEEGEAPVVRRVKKKLREAQARPAPTGGKTKANAAMGPARWVCLH